MCFPWDANRGALCGHIVSRGEQGLPSTGLPYVIVNGTIVAKNSKVLPVKPGKPIRFPVEGQRTSPNGSTTTDPGRDDSPGRDGGGGRTWWQGMTGL